MCDDDLYKILRSTQKLAKDQQTTNLKYYAVVSKVKNPEISRTQVDFVVVVVITISQLHSTKPELMFHAGLNST